MNPTIVDIVILFSFVPVWYIIFSVYERWNDPRARRRRQRKARYNKRMKELNNSGELRSVTSKKKEWRKVDYFMSQREIAKVLGITETDVKRIESRAIAKLKRSGKLERFLGAKE